MLNRNGLWTQSLISVFSCSCLRTLLCFFVRCGSFSFAIIQALWQTKRVSRSVLQRGSSGMEEHWSTSVNLFEHLTDTIFLHLYLFPVRKKKTTKNKERKKKTKHSEIPATCCSRSRWVPYWLTVRQQKRTCRSHQQLPLAWINFTSVIQNVQALAECSSTE